MNLQAKEFSHRGTEAQSSPLKAGAKNRAAIGPLCASVPLCEINTRRRYRFRLPLALFFVAVCHTGCHRDMRDQPRYEALEARPLAAAGSAALAPPAGTVARGELEADSPENTGKSGREFVLQIPLAIDEALVRRGQERFNIYCSPCHGRTGHGDGMIVARGFRPPPTFHQDRLRQAPAGHFFDVMTHGFGAMPRYGPQIPPRDRWAIVAYVRALQLSQNAPLDDLPASERARLEEAQP